MRFRQNKYAYSSASASAIHAAWDPKRPTAELANQTAPNFVSEAGGKMRKTVVAALGTNRGKPITKLHVIEATESKNKKQIYFLNSACLLALGKTLGYLRAFE